jgi:hypothetical protein
LKNSREKTEPMARPPPENHKDMKFRVKSIALAEISGTKANKTNLGFESAELSTMKKIPQIVPERRSAHRMSSQFVRIDLAAYRI